MQYSPPFNCVAVFARPDNTKGSFLSNCIYVFPPSIEHVNFPLFLLVPPRIQPSSIYFCTSSGEIYKLFPSFVMQTVPFLRGERRFRQSPHSPGFLSEMRRSPQYPAA